MVNFNLYYVIFGVVAFIISIYVIRWIFQIDELIKLKKESNDLLKSINDKLEKKE